MPTFRAPRGTRDLLPPERVGLARLERIAADLAARYGYRPIETPLFEQAASSSAASARSPTSSRRSCSCSRRATEDGERWALRPEPTAGIVRAYVQHGMQTWPQPVKVTLTGSMFRYDRPQAGRYRQFWQFDVEAIGDPGPAVDAEIIELAARFYRDVGLPAVTILLNSIGDAACRPAYVEELTAYYRAHLGELPPLERARLERNPLRLLDSKDGGWSALNAAAPQITDRLCDACAAHFAAVRAHLARARGRLSLEPRLVRGLDYYTRTAFEVYPGGRDRPAVGDRRRRPLRRSRRAARRQADAGDRVRARARSRPARARQARASRRPPEPAPVAVVVGSDPAATATRLRIATELRARRARGPGGAGPAQARQAARGGGTRRRALRGDPRRRARRRPRPAARPGGRDAAPGHRVEPRPGAGARHQVAPARAARQG